MNDAQRLQDDLALLTGMTAKERQDAIRWYARQSEEFRVRLMTSRFKTFQRLKQEGANSSMPLLEYTALLVAIKGLGWLANKKSNTRNMTISPELLKQISDRKLERALPVRTRAKREMIRKKWGVIVEYRRAGLGFRRIAFLLQKEHSVKVSHTYIYKLWEEWESNF